MDSVVDLGNPQSEPTDEELTALSARAFEGVRASHEAVLRRLRGRIAEERAAALLALAEASAPPAAR